jgi:hypothetical protein
MTVTDTNANSSTAYASRGISATETDVTTPRHWRSRRLPHEDWAEILHNVRSVRRSRRIEEGFEQ